MAVVDRAGERLEVARKLGAAQAVLVFGEAVDLLASGAVDPRLLPSEPLPLEGYGDAVDRVRAGQGIKWHVRPLYCRCAAKLRG